MPVKISPRIEIRDEGTIQGIVRSIDFTGTGIAATVSGDVATVNASAGSGAPTGATYVTIAVDGTLTNERVLTGTANQITITDNGAGSTVVLSLPQNIHTSADVQFDSLGLGIAAEGTTGTLQFATSNAVFFPYSTGSLNGLSLYPKGYSANTWFILSKGAHATDTGADQNQAIFRIFASPGANSFFGAGYFNPLITWGSNDGTNSPRAFELGVEGNVSAGTYSDHKIYLWKFSSTGTGGSTVFAMDHTTNPNQFRFPSKDASEEGVYVRIGGRQIDTQATDSVGGLDVTPINTAAASTGNYVKNDTNVRVFAHFRVKPELRTGASNTNTTLNVVDIDTTNTSVTGLTVNPIQVSYGGTQIALMKSNGTFGVSQLGAITPLVPFHAQGSSLGYVGDTFVDSSQGGGLLVRRGRGTGPTAMKRLLTNDDIGVYNARGVYNTVSDSDTASSVLSSGNAGQFRYRAAETWSSSSNQGCYFELATTSIGGSSATVRMIANDYGITIGTASVARGTTNPTNALTLLDGTAPVGTLTGGVTLYSTSGELRVNDAAGNTTLLSPHDAQTNEWIYDSVVTTTGKHLRIDMERLMRALDALLGGGYIHESENI